jgi:GNAT superfamily N-acetyltransferase
VNEFAAPHRLTREDQRAQFASGQPELDDWLITGAWQNQKAGNAVTYVITEGDRVVGYYAIAMATIAQTAAPEPLKPNRRPSQIPCILLARLAVDSAYQGQGLGFELLRDAMLRSIGLSDAIGAAAILVHCLDTHAKAFYLHLGDFLESPVDDLQLLAPIAALRRYVDGDGEGGRILA